MTLLTNADAQAAARQAIVLDLGDLRAQASSMIARARAEAEGIVEGARRERRRLIAGAAEEGTRRGVEEGLRVGREAGQARGRAEAIEAARAQAGTLCDAWQASLDTFAAGREDALASARQDLLRLALVVAERVTRRVIELDPSSVATAVEEAIAMCMAPTRLKVMVHPDDRALVDEVLPSLVERFDRAVHAELVGDAGVARGSCVVRTDQGEIDARLGVMLGRIADAVGVSGGSGS